MVKVLYQIFVIGISIQTIIEEIVGARKQRTKTHYLGNLPSHTQQLRTVTQNNNVNNKKERKLHTLFNKIAFCKTWMLFRLLYQITVIIAIVISFYSQSPTNQNHYT